MQEQSISCCVCGLLASSVYMGKHYCSTHFLEALLERDAELIKEAEEKKIVGPKDTK